MAESIVVPEAQLPHATRRGRNLAIAIGIAGFAFVTVNDDSALSVAVMSGAIVVAAVVFFTMQIGAQNRGWAQQDRLQEALGLEAEMRGGPFLGEVDGVPVTIRLRTKVGRSWDDRTDSYRKVTGVEATEVYVGRDRSAPPPALKEVGVQDKAGRWVWEGDGYTLDDPAMEAFVRRLVAA